MLPRNMQLTTHEGILECIQEAIGEMLANRRQHFRIPFFRPITISTDNHQGTKLSAFSKDISLKGIGLLHNFPLGIDQQTLTIPTISGSQVDTAIQVTWCQPCGEEWYVSGGFFTELSTLETTSLFLSTVLADAGRRLKQRYPFFRSIMITIGGVQQTKLPAFSTDISNSGIGLLHDMPLETQNVILTVPRRSDSRFDISAEVIWCKPCGHGCYLSGARFRRLMFEELDDQRL